MLPERLVPGDTLGVIAPSSPVTNALIGQYQYGIETLHRLGFRVREGAQVFSTAWGYAAAPRDKAADLNALFADPDVKGIICAQGGATANGCLPYLNWDVIRANPKIILGISDISVLLNAIYHRAGLVTFHGNDVMWGFGRPHDPYDEDEFLARLVRAEIGAVKQSGSRRTVRGGTGEGRLLGGNLHCLLKLAGTPYSHDFSGAILFIEAIHISSEHCDAAFQQLMQMGVFDDLRGVLVGYIDGLQNDPAGPVQMEDVLLRVTESFDFPILKVNDFGHNCPNTTLPVGGWVRLDADAQRYEIAEACVR